MKIFLNASIFMTILCAVVFSGCATTQQNQQNVNNITLEGTLQKSAEIRGQVQAAKANYAAAKETQEAKGDEPSGADQAKAAVKEKVDAVKTQVKTEADAWKDAVK